MTVFKLKCSCGKHEFIFGKEPHKAAEVKCPVCGKVIAYAPGGAKAPKVKEVNNYAGTSK
ncbi:MAG: hypothetical protein MJA84_07190 [Firmicutes bacterium]|nr:hypothetical protein [Bacillota bacterium]